MGCPMSKRVQTSSDMSVSPVQTTDSSFTTPGKVKSESSGDVNICEVGYVVKWFVEWYTGLNSL